MRDLTKKYQLLLKISFSNGEIGCRVLGKGIKKIIVFYGFGQTAEDYSKFVDVRPDYTFYILDLPFHGETKISDPSKPIIPEEIAMIIDNLKKKEGINRFSLLGCSIGARLVYQVIEQSRMDLEEVLLVAPDGIRNNFWYRLATNTALMRAIFKKMIRSDKLLPGLISTVKELKLVDSKTSYLALKSADSRVKREKLYNTWLFLRKLRLHKREVSRVLNEFSIKTTFVVGTNDKMIPVSAITRLSSKLEVSRVVEVDAGHHNILNRYAEKLLNEIVENR